MLSNFSNIINIFFPRNINYSLLLYFDDSSGALLKKKEFTPHFSLNI
jgi:hypothetical protein